MPPRLGLRFLGPPQIQLDDEPISLERRKALALLAYLAVEPGPHARESLSALLWPDVGQSNAFKNLRQVLWEIQKTLGEGWLVTEHGQVRLRDADPQQVRLDVREFEDLFQAGGAQAERQPRISLLGKAARLYHGHFLTGFSLRDAFPFNDWAFARAEDLRHKLSVALGGLADDYCAAGQPVQAVPHARRLVSLDPLNEAAHRQLMEVYAAAGQPNAALKQYQELEQTLRRELNIDPQPETRDLYRRIRKGEMKPVLKAAEQAGASLAAPPTDLPSGIVTFLFTDVESSTRLANQYPQAMPALLARQHEILRRSLQAHGGYVFQAVGDSVAAAFPSARDALAAAVDAQQQLESEAWTPVPIKVRMAIHSGEAQPQPASDANPYSNYAALALTQRILAAAYGGQVLVSQAAQELGRGGLPAGSGLRELGECRFKDFPRAERIYQLVIPDLVSDFPPLGALGAAPNNLPVQLSRFIGREKEKAEVRDLITAQRLVTLMGPGGIGKTRLSLEVAHDLRGDFPGGAWFVELAALSDPELVPQTVVTTLGLIEQPGRPLVEILADFLRSKRALLILDNCEHLVQASAQLAQALLHACPQLHILATSREALGVEGEMPYLVPTLTTPDPEQATLESLSHYEATQLFIERAGAALTSPTLTEQNVPAIVQLCRQLDGIPLAIELAAARVKVMRVEEIAARLDDRFRLLTGGARTALPRHQTLQALIDWSHDLLSEPERVLLRRLSVFAGGWTLEAAEAVCAGVEGGESIGEEDSLPPSSFLLYPSDVLDLLTSLVNKSLIGVEPASEPETRYAMLETIRQYARQRLWQAGEEEAMRQRHLAYYVDLAERAEPNLRAPDMILWLDRLEAEHENIRFALEWGLESDIEAELRLAGALLWFWHIRGHKNEGVEWLERALSIEGIDHEGRPRAPGRARARGKALNASGSLMVMNHEFGRAPIRLQESVALFRDLGPVGRQGLAYALLRSALLPSAGAQARSMLEHSLALFREIGDRFGTAETLMHLSGIAQKDDYEQALRFAQEELSISREIGDRDGIAVALTNQADLALSQDDYPRAIALFNEALAMFRAVKNTGAVSLGLVGYGDVFFWQGDFQRAAQTFEGALAFAEELGYRFLIAFNLYNLGIVAWLEGDYARAARSISDSQSVFQDIGNHWLAASSLHALGDIALADGREEEAARWYEDELAFGRRAELEAVQVFARHGLGKAAWASSDYDRAARQFEETLSLSRAADIKPAAFHSLYGLGLVAQSRDDLAAAGAFYREALGSQTRRISPLYNWPWLKTYKAAVSYPLAGLGIVAARQNKLERAVRLLGAAETLYSPLRFEISARERAELDGATGATRAALGEEGYAEAWEEGRNMTLEQASAYALRTD